MVDSEIGMVKYLDIQESVKSLLSIIYLIFIIYLGYQIILAIFGGTWSTENIIIAGMGITITGMFTILGFQIIQSKTLGKIEERTRFLEEKIRKVEDRLSKIENRLSVIEKKI